MAEQSFPMIEKPMTDDQWKSVTLGIGDGILDGGGNPYKITLSNQTDQATIGLDSKTGYNHAILKGFYHKMDQEIALAAPAVTAKTTYTVALQYDPTRQDMPVKLGIFKGNLDRSSGKEYLVLWAIVRSPNQLLSDATLTEIRAHVTPVMQVNRFQDLPEPATVLYGSEVHCRWENTVWRAEGSRWRPMSEVIRSALGMGGWDLALSTKGIAVRPVEGGIMCRVSGAIRRTAETYTVTGWSVCGTMIPSNLRPDAGIFTVGLTGDDPTLVTLNPSGQIALRPAGTKNGQKVSKGDNVSFAFEWFIATGPGDTW